MDEISECSKTEENFSPHSNDLICSTHLMAGSCHAPFQGSYAEKAADDDEKAFMAEDIIDP